MRKVLLLVVGLLPVFLWGQAQRMVLIEHFTNASCAPCAAQNPDFHALLSDNTSNVVSLKYQAPFPGFDPMNQANPTQVNTRGDYYGLEGVPTAWIDGILPGDNYAGGIGDWDVAGGGYEGGPYGYNQDVLSYAAGQSTPITIELTHSLNAALDEITITAVVTNTGAEDLTLTAGRFHVVLVEKTVNYLAPPGSNGEMEFHNVMRRMYPSDQGAVLNTLAAGASTTVTYTEPLPAYIADKREIAVIAFFQNNTNKSVLQAAYSEPQAIANALDASFGENLTVAPTELCGATIDPSITVFNNGEAEITSFEIGLAVNGDPVGTESWTGTLAAGASTTITFEEYALNGTSILSFVILEVNGEDSDINSLNNQAPSATYAAFSDDVYGTELSEDNEDYEGVYPAIAVIEEPVENDPTGTFLVLSRADLTNTAGDAVGGFGQSDRSIFINFYQWNPAEANAYESGTLTYPKLDFSNTTNSYLKFDRSHARYQGSTDRLQVLVSPDCGDTWTVVYNKAGAQLATRPDQNGFFIPPANGWVTDSVSLSAFDGTPELNIQFKAISAWGNNLFIDNINVSGLVVGTNDLEDLLAGKVSVFPNPASTAVNIEFELVEATPVTIEILNVNGQKVATLDQNRDYAAGQYMRTWNPENAGIYMARIRTELGESTQRIVVTR